MGGRNNFLLKRVLPAKQYTNLSSNFTETLDLTEKGVIAVVLSITLDPQTDPLPLYFNIIDDSGAVDSLVIFRDYFEVTAKDTLVMSNIDATVLTDAGRHEIPSLTNSLSISMTSYFLDEYVKQLTVQFIREKPGATSSTATLAFFGDVLTNNFS